MPSYTASRPPPTAERSPLHHIQQSPPRQRRGLIIQKHNPPRLWKWQIRADAPAIDPDLLQNLPVSRIVRIEPGALAQHSPAPTQRKKALARLPRLRQPLLQFVDLPAQQIEVRPCGVLPMRREQPRRVIVRRFENPAAIEGFLPADYPPDLRLREKRFLL